MSSDTAIDDDDENNSTVRLLTNFSSSYLYIRVKAAEKTAEFFQQTPEDDAKPGPYKRLARALMGAFIDKQYTEKLYRKTLTDAITVMLTSKGLPINFQEFSVDYLVELKSRFSLSATKATGIDFCIAILKTFKGDNESVLPIWVSTSTQILGELFDSLESDRGGKVDKISQQCTTIIGKLMQNNPQLLTYAIPCWSENSYICSLTQLYQYFSAVKIIPSTSTLRPKVTVTYDTIIVQLGKSLADLISKKVLNAKQPLPAYILYRLGEFLERLSMVEWNESIDPDTSGNGTKPLLGAISTGLYIQIYVYMYYKYPCT
jgi:hypothetical protein